MSARPKEPEAPRFKKPMLAKCTSCNHVWPLVWLPMEMAAASPIRRAAATGCPACGQTNSSSIVMASDADGIIWNSHHPSMKEEVRV